MLFCIADPDLQQWAGFSSLLFAHWSLQELFAKYDWLSWRNISCRTVPWKGFWWRSPTRLLLVIYCWFSHDVTKIQTSKLSIEPIFYFHDVLEQRKTNFHTNFRFKRVLGCVIEYAWISKILRDAVFTWRSRELSCWWKKLLISGNFAL